MKSVKEIRVPASGGGVRLDVFLARSALGLSRRTAADLISGGDVRVDGRAAPKSAVLCADQTVSVVLPEKTPPAPDAGVRIDFLYEDADLIAVAKPAGAHTVPQSSTERGSVAQGLLARYPEMAGIGATPLECGVCHRLDFRTSGVVIAARTPEAYAKIRGAFSAHQIRKTYLALCAGSPPDAFRCDEPIGHPSRRSGRVRVGGRGRGVVSASTAFETVRRFASSALVRAACATGAMHQVRAHAAHAGFPLVGDALYGGPVTHAGRFFLHALAIELPHPRSGEPLRIECPIPEDFQAEIDRLSQGIASA